MFFVLPAVFAAALFFDFRGRYGREKRLYIALSVIALALSVLAGFAAQSDHVGASFSGMISIFRR